MKTNVALKFPAPRTHAGAVACRINDEQALRRSVMSCLLWEGEFYEDGASIADRIKALAGKLPFDKVAAIAIEAKERMKLRHVPLWLAVSLADRKAGKPMGDLLARLIQRADELSEFLALYWKGGKKPLAKQVKRGLALAFGKFDEYALGKYNRDGAVKLRDALFLCHAKPANDEQAALWSKLAKGELATPDTWEVALSGGADKRETFERLMAEKKLGGLAFLRNLRNMQQAGVPDKAVRAYFGEANFARVLPFRFISAAKHAPSLEDAIEPAMLSALGDAPKLAGKTALLVDHSGSMGSPVSGKSDLSRLDAAAALAILLREVCEGVSVIGFSNEAHLIAPRRGFALRDLIMALPRGGTWTGHALACAEQTGYDRIIVITDEQSHQSIRAPKSDRAYFVNVASAKNGIGYGKWTHIDGWSEAVVDYIRAAELAG